MLIAAGLIERGVGQGGNRMILSLLALPLTSCVIVGKEFNHSNLQFPFILGFSRETVATGCICVCACACVCL